MKTDETFKKVFFALDKRRDEYVVRAIEARKAGAFPLADESSQCASVVAECLGLIRDVLKESKEKA